MPAKRLGEILTDLGWISAGDLEAGLESQQRDGGRIGTCLLEMGSLTELRLISALSYQLGVPAALAEDLTNIPSEIHKLVPARLAVRWKAIPFRLLGDELHVAMLDTRHLGFQDELAFATGKQIRTYTGNEARIVLAMERYFGFPAAPRYRQLVERLDQTPEPSNDDWQTTLEVTESDVFGETSPLAQSEASVAAAVATPDTSSGSALEPAPVTVSGIVTNIVPTVLEGPTPGATLPPLATVDPREEPPRQADPWPDVALGLTAGNRAAGSRAAGTAEPSHPGSDTAPQAAANAAAPIPDTAQQTVVDTSPQARVDVFALPDHRPPHVITEPMEVQAVLDLAAAAQEAQEAQKAQTDSEPKADPRRAVTQSGATRTPEFAEKRPRPRLVIASSRPSSRPEAEAAAPRPPARIAASLVEALRHYFDRVLAFRINEGNAVGWCGSGTNVDQRLLAAVSVDLGQPSVFHNLLHGAACHMGPVPPMVSHRAVAAVWGAESIGDCLVLPIRVQKHLLAIVLCERNPSTSGTTSLALPEITSLVTAAAHELERCIIHHKLERSDRENGAPTRQSSLPQPSRSGSGQRLRVSSPAKPPTPTKSPRDTAEVPALEPLPTPAWKEKP